MIVKECASSSGFVEDFNDKDIQAAYNIGKPVAGRKRTMKVVFDNAWYRHAVWNQREILKGKGIYMSEEPSELASKMGYEARNAH